MNLAYYYHQNVEIFVKLFLALKILLQLQGKITCSAVLSNMYAMGVTECDNMLMLLSISQKMTDKERDVVMPFIMSGFKVGIGFVYHRFVIFNADFVVFALPGLFRGLQMW